MWADWEKVKKENPIEVYLITRINILLTFFLRKSITADTDSWDWIDWDNEIESKAIELGKIFPRSFKSVSANFQLIEALKSIVFTKDSLAFSR